MPVAHPGKKNIPAKGNAVMWSVKGDFSEAAPSDQCERAVSSTGGRT